jgi:hypothetical protein
MVDDLTYEVLPDDYTQYDLSFKLIVIGDSSSNKLIQVWGNRV